MDKLSEHAIRMLEIADANDIPAIGNKQFRDIAKAIYDVILQVQMLKEVNRKENSSEKPNNCDDCIWSVCNYNKAFEDEPQTEDLQDWKDRMWAEAVIASKDEPQTEGSKR